MSNTPHGHWSPYDETLEMADFDAAHAILVAGGSDLAALTEALRQKGWSVGYGDADSHLTDMEGRDPDETYAKALQELFDDYQDGDYWNCIDKSETILVAAATTPEARSAAQALFAAVRDGYEAGRAERVANKPITPPTP
jgi:hypothetical protein